MTDTAATSGDTSWSRSLLYRTSPTTWTDATDHSHSGLLIPTLACFCFTSSDPVPSSPEMDANGITLCINSLYSNVMMCDVCCRECYHVMPADIQTFLLPCCMRSRQTCQWCKGQSLRSGASGCYQARWEIPDTRLQGVMIASNFQDKKFALVYTRVLRNQRMFSWHMWLLCVPR